MYIEETKKIRTIITALILLFSSHAFSTDFKCFKNQERIFEGISTISVGLVDESQYTSSLVVTNESGSRESAELHCPIFPKVGTCGLEGDGGEIDLEEVSEDGQSIKILVRGNLKVEMIQPEGYSYISVDSVADVSDKSIRLDRVSSKECNFFL